MENKHEKGSLSRENVLNEFVEDERVKEVEDGRTNREIALQKSLDTMLSTDDMEMKTDLTKNSIIELTKAQVILSVKRLPVILTFVDYFTKYSVSNDRQGRKELIKLTTNSYDVGENFDNTGFEKMKSRLM